MGNKCNPQATRLGLSGWKSVWCANKYNYAALVREDFYIRKTVESMLENDIVSDIKIQRSDKIGNVSNILVTIVSNRPGAVIGREGVIIKEVQQKVQKLFPQHKITLDILETYRAETNAKLIATSIAKQIEQKKNYKKAVNNAIMLAMKGGACGVKIIVAGRINGASIARRELFIKGSVPLASIGKSIQYWSQQSNTTYGIVGVRVYVNVGETNVITIS